MCCNFVLLAQLINTGSKVGDLSSVIALFLLPTLLLIGVLLLLLRIWRVRLRRHGYLGIKDYFRKSKARLRKLPQTDEEKLAAVELTLKGAVLFVLGLFFFPLIVIGLVPLYYGGRKLASIRLGLQEVEEEE
jgi:hypothetical protein